MSENQTTCVLNQVVGPICRTFNPASAQAWAQLQVDQAVQDRVEVLAEKCNEGMLSAEERIKPTSARRISSACSKPKRASTY